MVTRDEARSDLIEATRRYVAAQDDLPAVVVSPQVLIDGKDLLATVAPLTLAEVRERLERFDNAWSRCRDAWENVLRFGGT